MATFALVKEVFGIPAGTELDYKEEEGRYYIPNTNIWFTESEMKNKPDLFKKILIPIKPKTFPVFKTYEFTEGEPFQYYDVRYDCWEDGSFVVNNTYTMYQALGLAVPSSMPRSERDIIRNAIVNMK